MRIDEFTEEPIVEADFHNDLNLDILRGSIKKSITPRETAHANQLSGEENVASDIEIKDEEA